MNIYDKYLSGVSKQNNDHVTGLNYLAILHIVQRIRVDASPVHYNIVGCWTTILGAWEYELSPTEWKNTFMPYVFCCTVSLQKKY